jgi:DNA-binding transcriptional MerR regulator
LDGMAEGASGLSIGQVADRTGLSVHALRFYEREGILAFPIGRALGGRRVYSEQDIEWLTVCTTLRASGMPLPVIRQYADLVRQGAGNEEERLALLRRHEQAVIRQIQALTDCLDVVNSKVRVYEDHLAQGTECLEATAPSDDVMAVSN